MLHFVCVTCRAKSSLYRQPFKSVQKSGRINFKKRVFSFSWPVSSIAWVLLSRSELSQCFLFPRNSRHLTTEVTINFACEWRDKFRAWTIENWTVVNRGYFSHDSSHSENVASARRVFVTSITTDKTQQCILQNAEEDYVVQNSASIWIGWLIVCSTSL